MKIVLYVNTFLPKIGGRELVVHYLAKAYKELGHDVRVLGASGWRKYRKLDLGYPVYRYPTSRLFSRERNRFMQLWGDVTFRGCDVVHAHATYPAGYIAAQLKDHKNYPLIITPHGNDIHTIPELGHGLRLDPEKDKKIRYALKKADLITAISGSVEASLLDAGAEQAKIRAIPNGVDVERFTKRKAESVNDWLGIPASSRLIVTVGKFRPLKGQDVLIKAVPAILNQEPKAVLVIVGLNTEPLLPLIDELGLAGQVILTGSLKPPVVGSAEGQRNAEDKLADLYLNSDIYVSAGVAEGSEGLSLAVLEAMAAGVPIVASDISGNRDIVIDNENGLLVEPGDHDVLAGAILKILHDTEHQKDMSVKAREVAERYIWQEIAKMYLDVYREAIGIS